MCSPFLTRQCAERAFNKLARTFALQVEALKRYRDAGVDRAIFMLPSKSRDEVLPMLDQSAALVKGL